jgi:hypothetical protein
MGGERDPPPLEPHPHEREVHVVRARHPGAREHVVDDTHEDPGVNRHDERV